MPLVAATVMFVSGSFAYAGTIHGTVTNRTSDKLSAGDKVTLLSLSAALEEVQAAEAVRSLVVPSE